MAVKSFLQHKKIEQKSRIRVLGAVLVYDALYVGIVSPGCIYVKTLDLSRTDLDSFLVQDNK